MTTLPVSRARIPTPPVGDQLPRGGIGSMSPPVYDQIDQIRRMFPDGKLQAVQRFVCEG